MATLLPCEVCCRWHFSDARQARMGITVRSSLSIYIEGLLGVGPGQAHLAKNLIVAPQPFEFGHQFHRSSDAASSSRSRSIHRVRVESPTPRYAATSRRLCHFFPRPVHGFEPGSASRPGTLHRNRPRAVHQLDRAPPNRPGPPGRLRPRAEKPRPRTPHARPWPGGFGCRRGRDFPPEVGQEPTSMPRNARSATVRAPPVGSLRVTSWKVIEKLGAPVIVRTVSIAAPPTP